MSERASDQAVKNISRVLQAIAVAARSSGRDPQSVRLLLATKTVPAERIATVLEGVRGLADANILLGENRVQELVAKAPTFAQFSHQVHFIGTLQRNKINHVLANADCIETVSSVGQAEQVAQRVPTGAAPFEVFLQVNVSGEETKSGCSPQEAIEVATQVVSLPQLRLRGFMTIGLRSNVEKDVRAGYAQLRELRDSFVRRRIAGAEYAKELSMGMSNDFEWAIAEGATIVRIGSAIFGDRA